MNIVVYIKVFDDSMPACVNRIRGNLSRKVDYKLQMHIKARLKTAILDPGGTLYYDGIY